MDKKTKAIGWMDRAERIAATAEGSLLLSQNIAILAASAYRQGYSAAEEHSLYCSSSANILLRTILSEAKRTGSWTLPVDIQQRLVTMRREGLL